MARIDSYLAEYADYHRTGGNIGCHFIGIPLIIYAILAFLLLIRIESLPPFGLVTAAEILILCTFAYYAMLEFRLAFSMLIALVLIDVIARNMGHPILAGLAFVAGWIFQAIGHIVFEKKSPAFVRNLVHLLIGPLFLLNEVFHFRAVSRPA